MYDPRPHNVEALRLVVCPNLLVGSSFQQRCGSLREVVSGLASVKHLERNCDVENAVFRPESSTWTRQRTGQPANRKVCRVRFVQIPMPTASQFQEGINVALGEILAARPHVGDEAAGALGTEGEVRFDLPPPIPPGEHIECGKAEGPAWRLRAGRQAACCHQTISRNQPRSRQESNRRLAHWAGQHHR